MDQLDTETAMTCDRVIGLLGRDRASMRRLQIPNMPRAEVPGVVQSESEREYGSRGESMIIDHCVLDPWETKEAVDELDVDIVMASNEVVNDCLEQLPSAIPKMDKLGFRPFEIWNAVTSVAGAAHEPTMLAVNAEESVELIIGVGHQVLLSDIASNDNLPGSIRRLLAEFSHRTGHEQIQQILLVGGPEDAARLEDAVSIAVAPVDLAGSVEWGSNLQPSLREGQFDPNENCGIIAAISTAQGDWSIDFLNPKRAVLRPTSFSRPMAWCAASVVLLLLLGMIGAQLSMRREAKRIEQLMSQRKTLDAQLQDAEQTLEQFRVVQSACDDTGNSLLELRRLSMAIHDKSRLYATDVTLELDRANVEDRRVTLSGFASDYAAISELQQTLGGRPNGPVRGSDIQGTYRYRFESSIPVEEMGANDD